MKINDQILTAWWLFIATTRTQPYSPTFICIISFDSFKHFVAAVHIQIFSAFLRNFFFISFLSLLFIFAFNAAYRMHILTRYAKTNTHANNIYFLTRIMTVQLGSAIAPSTKLHMRSLQRQIFGYFSLSERNCFFPYKGWKGLFFI